MSRVHVNHVLCTVHIFEIDAEIRKPFCQVTASQEAQNAATEDP